MSGGEPQKPGQRPLRICAVGGDAKARAAVLQAAAGKALEPGPGTRVTVGELGGRSAEFVTGDAGGPLGAFSQGVIGGASIVLNLGGARPDRRELHQVVARLAPQALEVDIDLDRPSGEGSGGPGDAMGMAPVSGVKPLDLGAAMAALWLAHDAR